MKKILSLFVAVTLLFCFSQSVFAANAESENTPVSALLLPYLEVIEKVNEETGSQIYVPAGKEEAVYNYYKDYSLEEFEQSLLNDIYNYNKTSDSAQVPNFVVIDDFSSTFVTEPSDELRPMAMVEEITQIAEISHNSYLYLYATVFGGGNPTTYTYKTVEGIAIGWPSGYTGFHFGLSSWSYSFSADRKTCTVTLKGSPVNAAGLMQTVMLTETVTFSAN